MPDATSRPASIAGYRFGDERRFRAIVHRLSSENGWSRSFAARAADEYLRFMTLLSESPAPLSPSDMVDQVWHLHLLHSREYRENFCGRVVGRFLDHHPGLGEDGDGARHEAQYAAALAAYRARFGEPPPDIWPTKPFEARYRRVDLGTHRVFPRLKFLFRFLS